MKNVYGRFFALLCLLFYTNQVNGKAVDTLKNIKDEALIDYSFRYFQTEIQYTDSATAFHTLDKMMQIAGERNSCELRMCATFLKGKYSFVLDANRKFKTTQCLSFFDSVLAQKQCSDILHTEAMFFKGYVLTRTPDYSKGFEYIIRAKEKAKTEGFSNFPNTFELYALLGNTFYSFSDYENSLTYLLEAVKFQGTVEMREAVDLYNTIALCYRQMGNYDSAGYYFQHAFQLASTAHVSDWIGIVSGNIGELLFRKQIRMMLDGPEHKSVITAEIERDFETYMDAQHIYFDGNNYDNAGTNILFTAINQYEYVASNAYFKNKKDLLEFQVQLIEMS